jgi:hypothetical protein
MYVFILARRIQKLIMYFLCECVYVCVVFIGSDRPVMNITWRIVNSYLQHEIYNLLLIVKSHAYFYRARSFKWSSTKVLDFKLSLIFCFFSIHLLLSRSLECVSQQKTIYLLHWTAERHFRSNLCFVLFLWLFLSIIFRIDSIYWLTDRLIDLFLILIKQWY